MMNIELTTTDLQSLCRFCLNDGELNVWKHTIKFPPTTTTDQEWNGTSDEASLSTYVEEVTVHEMLHIFGMWEHKILDLDAELQLICHACMNELLNCYIFYKKLVIANRQVNRLFKAALKIEGDQKSNQEGRATRVTSENVNFKTESDTGEPDAYASVDYEEFHSDYETIGNNLTVTESATRTTKLEPNTRQTTKHAKIVLTEGLTKLLGHMESPAALNTVSTTSFKRQHGYPLRMCAQKRPRYTEVEYATSPATMHRNASFVVGHFTTVPSKDSAHDKLLTIDYAPVEIKSTHIHQITDFSLPLPASTEFVSTSASPSSVVDPVYKCKYCPQAFSAIHYLMAHVRKTHVCLFCTLAFPNQNELNEHARQVHRQHKCAICSKELSNHSSLRAHIKRIHAIHLPPQVALLDYRRTDFDTDCVGEVEELDCDVVGTEDFEAETVEEAEAAIAVVASADNYMQIADSNSDDPNTYLMSMNCA